MWPSRRVSTPFWGHDWQCLYLVEKHHLCPVLKNVLDKALQSHQLILCPYLVGPQTMAVHLDCLSGFVYFITTSANLIKPCSDFPNILSSFFLKCSQIIVLTMNSTDSLWSFDITCC